MSIFSDNKSKVDGKLGFSPNDKDYLNSNTLIGSNTRIEGTIRCEGNLRIDGELVGDIFCENKLIVGSTGAVYGNIVSRFLDLEGKVNGNIEIMAGLRLKSKSLLKGDIELFSGHLEIENEAEFNGVCQMNKSQEKSEMQEEPPLQS